MTQKLQTLAINALEDLKKDLWENTSGYYFRLFEAWTFLIHKNEYSSAAYDIAEELIDSMIESYKNNSKNIPLRHYYVESNHIRIQVDIHGGLKDASGKVDEPFQVFAKILLS
jgi:hypothetical protein